MAKIKRASIADPETQSVKQWVAELVTAKAQQKFLKSRQDAVTKRIKGFVEENGYTDDQGHVWFDLDEPVEGAVALQMQRKVSMPLREEKAAEILKAKGLYEDCTVTIVQVDQDAVMAAHFRGDLSEDDIDSMFPKSVTYALLTPTSK